MSRYLFFFLFFLPALSGFAMKDTLKKDRLAFDTTHSPKKAMLLSAVLPGAGQAYNRKFWKMPIVYAAMGTSVYFIIENNRNYKLYRSEYVYRLNNGGSFSNPDLQLYSDGQLRILLDQYRRWRDLSYVALAGFYALQIVDAAVDGYLWRHDTSRDLSFAFRPSFISTTGGMLGFKMRLKF